MRSEGRQLLIFITKPRELLIGAGYCWDPVKTSVPSKSIFYCGERNCQPVPHLRLHIWDRHRGESSRKPNQQHAEVEGQDGVNLPEEESHFTKHSTKVFSKSFLAKADVIILCWVMISDQSIIQVNCRHVFIYDLSRLRLLSIVNSHLTGSSLAT